MKSKILFRMLIIFSLFCLFEGGFSCGGGGSGGPSAGTGTPPPDGGSTPPPDGGGTPPPVTLPSCKEGYCLIPEAKEFKIGSIDPEAATSENLPDGANRKLPPKVTISGFLMGKTEVTIGQYMSQFVAGTPPPWQGDPSCDVNCQKVCNEQYKRGSDHPMICLTFQEKQDYCKKQGGDLPTAAQFERAAKGVSGTDKYGSGLPEEEKIKKAILGENGFMDTEVPCGAGEKDKEERANSFGVCDLSGNLLESTSDAYNDRFYDSLKEGDKDPKNLLTDPVTQAEEFRGGSFGHTRRDARSSIRFEGDPTGRFYDLGFRCVRPLPQ